MLVICTKTGLTYDRRVYKEGEVFFLSGILEREYKDLSDERWLRKQNKTYGAALYRRPTPDELIVAIQDKKLDPGSATVRGHLTKQQLRVALDYAESKEQKKLTGIRMLREGLDMEIEGVPEEKASEEAPEAPEEEPKAEESVKEPEALEEKSKPEEPKKEAPGKKDKKKDK